MLIEVSLKQKLIIDKINCLTKSQAYGDIVIVMRKGKIADITISEKIKLQDEKEEPDSNSLRK